MIMNNHYGNSNNQQITLHGGTKLLLDCEQYSPNCQQEVVAVRLFNSFSIWLIVTPTKFCWRSYWFINLLSIFPSFMNFILTFQVLPSMSNNLKGLYWYAFLIFFSQTSFSFEPIQYLLHAIFALIESWPAEGLGEGSKYIQQILNFIIHIFWLNFVYLFVNMKQSISKIGNFANFVFYVMPDFEFKFCDLCVFLVSLQDLLWTTFWNSGKDLPAVQCFQQTWSAPKDAKGCNTVSGALPGMWRRMLQKVFLRFCRLL